MRNGLALSSGVFVAVAVVFGAELKVRASDVRDAATALAQLRATDLDGREWTAEQLRGRVVLIDFWATWCAPCLAELPRLKELRAQYPRSEFEILGVMLEPSSKRAVVSWLNRNRIDWPQIHERRGYGGPLAAAFGVRQLPATVLVDADGRVAAVDLRGDTLRARVDELVRAARASGKPARLRQGSGAVSPKRACEGRARRRKGLRYRKRTTGGGGRTAISSHALEGRRYDSRPAGRPERTDAL